MVFERSKRDVWKNKKLQIVKNNEVWFLAIVVFGEDVAENATDLKIMIDYLYRVCLCRRLKVNVAKS